MTTAATLLERKFEITFEPIEHKYTVKNHEDRIFTSVTTFIHETFFPSQEEFSLSESMYFSVLRRIQYTINVFESLKHRHKDKKARCEEEVSKLVDDFLRDTSNIRHVPKLALLNKDACVKCCSAFTQETLLVEYLFKANGEDEVAVEKKDPIPIHKCSSCYNRYPSRIFTNTVLPEDIAGLWQISRDDGTNLHAFIEDFINGEYKNEDEINMAAYATRGGPSFLQFYEDAGEDLEIIASEFRVASVEFGLAGTIDAVALVNGIETIIDLKGVKLITEERPYYKLKAPFDFFKPNKLWSG